MLPMVSVVQADVHDPAQLAALLPGHDAVINLIAILHGTQAKKW
jgi:NADH dehydrogenase